MAVIRVDFDEVMHFGDLHRDIGASLRSARSVYDRDAQHLDRIINEFALPRTTNNPHFNGLSLPAAFENADARALRVSEKLMITASRIFTQAQPVDSHFDWGSVLWSTVRGTVESAGDTLGDFLLEAAGGQIVDKVVAAGVAGVLSPGVIFVAPLFLVVSGGVSLFEGWSQVRDAAGDVWEQVAGGLKLVSGGITFVVGGFAVGVMVVGASVGAFLSTPFVLAALGVAAIAGVAALAIDHRHHFAELLGFDDTSAEREGNRLSGGPWSVPLGPAKGPTIVAEFTPPTATSGSSPSQWLQPTAPAAVLQDPNSRLVGVGPEDPGSHAAPDRPDLGQSPVAPVPQPYSSGPLPISNAKIADSAEAEIAADPGRYRGQVGWSQPGECMMAMSRWLGLAGGSWGGSPSGPNSGFEKLGAERTPTTELGRGDVLQRASTTSKTSWSHVHTVVVLSVDPDNPELVTVAESNYDLNGSMRIHEYDLSEVKEGYGWTGWRLGANP